jgi:WD40 repeat protein
MIACAALNENIMFWDVKTGAHAGKPIQGSKRSTGILSLVFSPDGKKLAAAYQDCAIYLWIVDVNLPIPEIYTHNINGIISLVFSSDGQYLVAMNIDGSGQSWDLLTDRTTKIPHIPLSTRKYFLCFTAEKGWGSSEDNKDPAP